MIEEEDQMSSAEEIVKQITKHQDGIKMAAEGIEDIEMSQ